MSTISFVGRDEVNTFVMVVLRSAIKLYVETGMKANRDYTPANMLAKAGKFTGKTYRRGQLSTALVDLNEKINELKREAQ